MISRQRLVIMVCFLLSACFCILSCSEKKEGKVLITKQEFSIHQDAENSWVINAKGKIRNVGEVDVKKVVLTAYCRSCADVIVASTWFVTGINERTSVQKDVISYLAVGGEEKFSVSEVAFYFAQTSGQAPKNMPDNLEIVIESFETVE